MKEEQKDQAVLHDTRQAVKAAAFDPDALRDKYRRERDKRLRAEGNDQYIEVTRDFAHFLDDPYA